MINFSQGLIILSQLDLLEKLKLTSSKESASLLILFRLWKVSLDFIVLISTWLPQNLSTISALESQIETH